SLAQAYGQIGNESPDVDSTLLLGAFKTIQRMIDEGLVLSLHDRSDGGLGTTLIEMCLAGNCGANVSIDGGPELFSEELGLVFEYRLENGGKILEYASRRGIPFKRL